MKTLATRGSSGSWQASFAIFAGAVVALAVVVTNLSGPAADPTSAPQAVRDERMRGMAEQGIRATPTVRTVTTREDAQLGLQLGLSADPSIRPTDASGPHHLAQPSSASQSDKSPPRQGARAASSSTLDWLPVLGTAYGEFDAVGSGTDSSAQSSGSKAVARKASAAVQAR